MSRLNPLLISLFFALPAVQTDAACEDLAQGFSKISGLRDFMHETSDQKPTCARSLQMGGAAAIHCYIPFDYRSRRALTEFADLRARLAACSLETSETLAVNHPDSFDQRWYCAKSGRVSVSLKDKAALGKTLVFMTYSAANCPDN